MESRAATRGARAARWRRGGSSDPNPIGAEPRKIPSSDAWRIHWNVTPPLTLRSAPPRPAPPRPATPRPKLEQSDNTAQLTQPIRRAPHHRLPRLQRLQRLQPNVSRRRRYLIKVVPGWQTQYQTASRLTHPPRSPSPQGARQQRRQSLSPAWPGPAPPHSPGLQDRGAGWLESRLLLYGAGYPPSNLLCCEPSGRSQRDRVSLAGHAATVGNRVPVCRTNDFVHL